MFRDQSSTTCLIPIYLPTGLILLMMFCLPSGLKAAYEEMAVELTYKRLVRTYVDALFNEEMELLLPLGEVCNTFGLRFVYRADDSAATIERPWTANDLSIHADGTVVSDGDTTRLNNALLVAGPVELHADSRTIEFLLDIKIAFNFNELRSSIIAQHNFPIDDGAARRKRRRGLEQKDEDALPPGARFLRSASLFDAGFVNYRLGLGQGRDFNTGEQHSSIALSLQTLGELFAGDYSFDVNAIKRGNGDQNINLNGRWRLYLGDAALQQIRLGAFTIGDEAVYGLDLSTRQLLPEAEFDETTLEVECPDGWECELYLNNRYIAMQRGDTSGLATFTLPLLYGAQRYELQRYSRYGDRDTIFGTSLVPRDFLRARTFDWSLTAGLNEAGSVPARAIISYGLSALATADFNTHLDGDGLLRHDAGIRLRINEAGMAELRHELSKRSTFLIQAQAGRTLRVGGDLEWRHDAGDDARADLLRAGFSAAGSLALPGQRLGWELDAQSRLDGGGRLGSDIELAARYSLTGVRLRAALRRQHSDEGGSGAARYQSRLSGRLTPGAILPLPAWFQQQAFGVEVRYDHTRQSFELFNIGLERSWRLAGFKLAAGFRFDLVNSAPQLGVSLAYDLAPLTTRAGYDISPDGDGRRLDLSGGLAVENIAGDIHPSAQHFREGAAVAVRFFSDVNNNGRHDENEPIATEPDVNFDRSVRVERDADGVIRILDLLPYTEYRVSVNPESLLNPMLAPAFRTFSVVTDPNRVKRIDIPMLPAAMIEGAVSFGAGRPAAGLRYVLVQQDGTPIRDGKVYRDGLLYEAGLGPGAYLLQFDTEQLQRLGLAPAQHAFTVGNEGQVVELGDIKLVQ